MGELLQFPGSYKGETSALQKFLAKAKGNALPMASKAGTLGVGALLLNELYQGGGLFGMRITAIGWQRDILL